MLKTVKSVILGTIAAALISVPAWAFETRAKAAFVIDQTTGTVLLTKNADDALPPASMSKLMTLYMAFEAVRDGRLSMEEKLPVSQHAMSYGGSTMFLDTTDRVRVEDLLRGIIVLSGNDACAVIAEALSPDGTEAGFARYMTKRAQELGMENASFANSNGWPAAGHRMSMRDLGILAERLIEDFPQYYPLFAEKEFAFDGRAPSNTRNRNPLLGLGIGADGLKTGHTSEAGYGLVGSAVQGDRRVILIDGKPAGAINRVPAEGETRSNMHVGGRPDKWDINKREYEICEAIGPLLRERGLIFVGIDVIGDWLTEINVTSPTCVRELNREFGLNIAMDLINAIEARLEAA